MFLIGGYETLLAILKLEFLLSPSSEYNLSPVSFLE